MNSNCIETYISELWADESSQASKFMRALGILVGPAYPHRWRWGFRWWHRWCCYSCVQARIMWPMMRKRMEIKLGMLTKLREEEKAHVI